MKKRADGRYQKKITLLDGRTKTLYSTANTESAAIKDFNKQLLKLEQERVNKTLFPKVAAAWKERYLETNSDINFRKNLRASYNRTVEYFKDCYVGNITVAEVAEFLEYLKCCKLSYKTVASHKSVLNMILQYAIMNKYIKYNPVKDVAVPNGLARKRRSLPSDEELKIVNENYEGFDFLPYFLLNTGLRISEALPLEVDKDFDFDNKTLTVNKHLIYDSNKPVIENVAKTENAVRTVILLDRVIEKMPKKEGLLFCNDDGTPYTARQLQKQWKIYRERHGVTLTAHQLRHGYATMLFEAGISVKDAQELMGHSDIKLTQQIYTHIRDKRRDETAKKLNAFSF